MFGNIAWNLVKRGRVKSFASYSYADLLQLNYFVSKQKIMLLWNHQYTRSKSTIFKRFGKKFIVEELSPQTKEITKISFAEDTTDTTLQLLYDRNDEYPYKEENQTFKMALQDYDHVSKKWKLNTSKFQQVLSKCKENIHDRKYAYTLAAYTVKEIEHGEPKRCPLGELSRHSSHGEAHLQTYDYRLIGWIFRCFDDKKFIMSKQVKSSEWCVRPDLAISKDGVSVEAMMEIKDGRVNDPKDMLKSIMVCYSSVMARREKGTTKSIEIPFLIGNNRKLSLYSKVLEPDDEHPKTFQVCSASLHHPDQMKELYLDLKAIMSRSFS